MENIYFFEIISEVFTFSGSEYAQRETDEGPQVNNRVMSPVVIAQLMNLSMTVMAPRNTIIRSGCLDLLIFQLAVSQPLILVSGLKESAAPAAAVVIRSVGNHVNEVFFPHNRFHHKTQIFRNRVSVALPHNLARILNRKLDFQVFVPVGIDFQFAFTDPFCIIFIDVFDNNFVLNIEFFQSCQD